MMKMSVLLRVQISSSSPSCAEQIMIRNGRRGGGVRLFSKRSVAANTWSKNECGNPVFRFVSCAAEMILSPSPLCVSVKRSRSNTEDGREVRALRYQSVSQVISSAFRCILLLLVDIPKDERPNASLQPVVIEGAPPSPQDDLATG